MSNSCLKLWVESVNEYCKKNDKPYHVPKKNTAEYSAIKKIYEGKKGGKPEPKAKSKNCKCRCKCDCPKP